MSVGSVKGISQVVDGDWILGWSSGTYWPDFVTVRQQEWAKVAKMIMRFEPDYGAATRRIYGWNTVPQYPKYLRGNIDDTDKPYMPGPVLIDGSLITGAAHYQGRLLAARKPAFSRAPKNELTGHYKKHDREFTYPDAITYEQGAQAIILNGRGSDGGPIQTHVCIGAGNVPKGRVYIYSQRTNEFVAFDPWDDTLASYQKPDRGAAYWADQLRK